ncbi:MAG TPA: O-antigen ligase family protein [Verrucomicrobiae bacterium]|nr:O-antigen ligase family protein [Verrucomicrobiae bacterium]
MANSFVATRAHLAYALCLPIAVLLGYLLADPTDMGSVLMVLLLISALSIPILMRWYHPLLVLAWNAAITPVFLPGAPFLWMVLAFVGLLFALLNRFTSPDERFVWVPSLAWPLLFLAVVLLGTAFLRGGIGSRAFGSSQYGARNNFYVLAAIAGYFTLTSRRIPLERAGLLVSLFFLSGLTNLVPNLAFMGGSKLSFLFYFFPSLYAQEQASAENSMAFDLGRLTGLAYACTGIYCWLMAKYGLRGIIGSGRPLRLALFGLATAACLFTGFRGSIILFGLTVAAMFWLEGLFKPKIVLAGLGALILACAITLPNADRLPLVIQRTISFLPVKIDPVIRLNAQGSSEWRIRMWEAVLPQVPRYLLLGKGFNIDSTDLQFANFNPHAMEDYKGAMTAEDFHNGILTLIIPLGIWGFGAFVVFLVIGWRFLYRNYRFGRPELKLINTLILAYFTARAVYYFLIFGSFFVDLFVFTGLVGLSVSLNGVQTEAPEEELAAQEEAHEEAFATLQHHRENR